MTLLPIIHTSFIIHLVTEGFMPLNGFILFQLTRHSHITLMVSPLKFNDHCGS